MKLDWEDRPYLNNTEVFAAVLPDGSRLVIYPEFTLLPEDKTPRVVGRSIQHRAAKLAHQVEIAFLGGDSADDAKKVAEGLADEMFPLQALGKIAEENPAVPQPARGAHDKEAIKRIRRFLSVAHHPDKLAARLGRRPTVREVAQATRRQARIGRAAWHELNAMLQPFLAGQEASPPGWVIAVRPKTRPLPTRPAPSPQKKLRRQIKAARAEFEKALRRVFGRPWYRLDRDTRDGIISEAYVQWLERTGGGDKVDPDDAANIARAIRRSRRAAMEKEVQFGEHSGDEPGEYVSPEEAEAESARQDFLSVIEQQLEGLEAQGPEGKVRTTLIRLHLGELVFPNQPPRLRGKQPALDFRTHHPGAGSECPTCRAIARYVRTRGLTADAVGHVIDDFRIQVKQEAGA